MISWCAAARSVLPLMWLLSGCAPDGGSRGPDPEGTRYTIALMLDPRAEQLTAEVQVDLPSRVSGEPLEFLLHGDLELNEVSGPDVERVDTVPGFNPLGLPESHLRLVTLHLKPGNGPTRLSWRYAGWIAPDRVQLGPDAFYPDWVELDVGSVWIPIRRTMTEGFTYRAAVTVPEGYEVVGAGRRRHSDGVWHFETEQPFLTASLAVAPAMRSFTVEGDVPVTVHNPGRASRDRDLAGYASRITSLFTRRYGAIPVPGGLQIVMPPATRARAEAYARDRYLMMSHDMTSGVAELAILAHETAHLWWNGAPSQAASNFLNESFAEYSAWLAVEDVYGAEALAAKLAEGRAAAEGTGSIRDWTPATNYRLVYRRGPVLLHDLRTRIGSDRFFALVAETRLRRVTDIDTFIALIAEQSDAAAAAWFREAF